MSQFCSNIPQVWDEGVPAWMPDSPAPYTEAEVARIAGYELDLSVRLQGKPKRLLHSLSVGLTAERLAALYGVDPYLARIAGILHDWSKALPREQTIGRARELGIELGADLELVEPLLHGMIAARELPSRYPEVDPAVWQAIDRHTLGNAHMSPLDMVVFVADGIEPRRKPAPAIVRQRNLVGTSALGELFLTSFSDGITYVIDTRRYLYPGTLAIYNEIVLARKGRAGKEA